MEYSSPLWDRYITKVLRVLHLRDLSAHLMLLSNSRKLKRHCLARRTAPSAYVSILNLITIPFLDIHQKLSEACHSDIKRKLSWLWKLTPSQGIGISGWKISKTFISVSLTFHYVITVILLQNVIKAGMVDTLQKIQGAMKETFPV